MSDEIKPRVFDSVTAAVANSAPPPPPPYAPEDASAPKAAKSPRKAAVKKTAVKKQDPEPIREEPVTGVTVQAGTAGMRTKAHGTK